MLRYYLFVILAGPFFVALIALLAGGTGEALPMLTLSAYFVTAAAFLIDALVAILVRKLARLFFISVKLVNLLKIDFF